MKEQVELMIKLGDEIRDAIVANPGKYTNHIASCVQSVMNELYYLKLRLNENIASSKPR